MVVGYSFNLKTNELTPRKVRNPGAGKEHAFRAWRLKGSKPDPVAMRPIDPTKIKLDPEPDDDDSEE